MAPTQLDKLTPREREVLTLVAEGDSLAEIAQKLSRSLKTIESHRLSIGRKLKVNNRVELAKIAISHGLIKLGSEAQSLANTSQTQQRWIADINQAIGNSTGRMLLQKFCEAASILPTVDAAAICTTDTAFDGPQDKYKRIIKATSEGGKPGVVRRFHADGTACKILVDQGEHIIQAGACAAYPNDLWIQQIKAESYLGLSIVNTDGETIGGVVLLARKPMREISALREVVDFFAPRIAGALQNCIEIETLRSENDRLRSELVNPEHTPQVGGDGLGGSHFSNISRRVDPLAGSVFLRELIDAVCETYGFFAGGICALDPSYKTSQTLHAVSFCVGNEQCDPISYQAKGTPCEVVLKQGSLCLPDHAASAYPGDSFMPEHAIRGFCGNRLPSLSGSTAGVIWVVDKSPLADPREIEALLKFYAPRIGAELANFMQLEMLMQERERLESQLTKKNKPRAKARV